MKRISGLLLLMGVLLSGIPFNTVAQVRVSNPELIPFRKGAKWGYCNEKREIIIPCKYDSVAEYFYQNRAYVMLGSKFGYIDSAGKEVIAIRFDNGADFNDQFQQITWVKEQGKIVVIDLDGNKFDVTKVIMGDAVMTEICDGPEGNIIIEESRYGFVTQFKRDSITGQRTREVDTVIKPIYQNLNKTCLGVLMAELNGKWGTINLKNEIIIPFEWDYLMSAFPEPNLYDYAGFMAEKDGLYGVLDIKGNIIIPLKYHKIVFPRSRSRERRPWPTIGVIKVQTIDGKWGYVGQNGVEYFEE